MAEDLTADFLAGATAGFEPMRTNNFALEIAGLPGEGTNNLRLALETINLPTESNDEVELHYLNERRYVAGKVMFEGGSLTVKDFVTENVMKSVVQWRQQVYDPETGKIFAASNYKKAADLLVFGPDGQNERKWRLIGLWPQNANYGSLDMSNADLLRIEITLRYDKAIASDGLV